MKDLLEIIIITYNREKNLSETLNKILSESSPVKDCKITILDNNSTDGTKDLCKSLISKFPNIIYSKNNFNVGLSGNILKAMEIPTEKYFWILCDNDEINFENWFEVESAMKNDCDLIVIANSFEQYCKAAKNYESPYIKYLQCHLCSAAIYKTSNMTDEIMTLATLEAATVSPHMVMVFDILNNKKKIITTKPIIFQKNNENDYSLNRLQNSESSHYKKLLKNIEFSAGINGLYSFLNLIQDEKNKKDFKYLLLHIMPYFDPKRIYKLYKNSDNADTILYYKHLILCAGFTKFLQCIIKLIFFLFITVSYYIFKLKKNKE